MKRQPSPPAVKLHPFTCAECGGTGHKRRGCLNRSARIGAPVYCSRECAGLGRREHRSEALDGLSEPAYQAERRRLNRVKKAEYDKARREMHGESIRTQKRAYYKANAADIYARNKARRQADPELQRRYRAAQDRCQASPEWKAHKRQYDRRFRAVKRYGEEWADVTILVIEIENTVRAIVPNRTVLEAAKGTLNKKQTRRRQWDAKQKQKNSTP